MSTDAGKEIDYGAIMARIKANRDKLDACPRHLFPPIVGSTNVAALFGKKIACTHCGGEIDMVAMNFYIRGYEAAGHSGNDILPGWKDDNAEPRRKYFEGDRD